MSRSSPVLQKGQAVGCNCQVCLKCGVRALKERHRKEEPLKKLIEQISVQTFPGIYGNYPVLVFTFQVKGPAMINFAKSIRKRGNPNLQEVFCEDRDVAVPFKISSGWISGKTFSILDESLPVS